MRNCLMLICCLLLMACGKSDKSDVEKSHINKIDKPIENKIKPVKPVKRTTSKFDEVCKNNGGTKGCYGFAFECVDGSKIKPEKISCIDGEYIDESYSEEVKNRNEVEERKAQNREYLNKWRANDEQIKQLVSKSDSSSGSYYAPPSNYTPPSSYASSSAQSSSHKSVTVQGYHRKDGTYVRSHKRSSSSKGKGSRRK